jgi:hypothetical protein
LQALFADSNSAANLLGHPYQNGNPNTEREIIKNYSTYLSGVDHRSCLHQTLKIDVTLKTIAILSRLDCHSFEPQERSKNMGDFSFRGV